MLNSSYQAAWNSFPDAGVAAPIGYPTHPLNDANSGAVCFSSPQFDFEQNCSRGDNEEDEEWATEPREQPPPTTALDFVPRESAEVSFPDVVSSFLDAPWGCGSVEEVMRRYAYNTRLPPQISPPPLRPLAITWHSSKEGCSASPGKRLRDDEIDAEDDDEVSDSTAVGGTRGKQVRLETPSCRGALTGESTARLQELPLFVHGRKRNRDAPIVEFVGLGRRLS